MVRRAASSSRLGPQIRVDLALACLVLAIAAPIVQPLGFQQASRMALTAAVWEEGKLDVEGYPIGGDRAERGGITYSDKAPGQPFLAIPAYAAYRVVGGESYAELRPRENLGLWAVSVWSAAIPAALLAILLRRVLRRSDPELATPVAVATALGTLLLPFASVLFGHVLSALLAFGAWAIVARGGLTTQRAVAAGFLLGTAISVEYTIAVAGAAIGVLVAVTDRFRFLALCAGAVPPAALVMLYQWAAFGHPLQPSYAHSTFAETAEELGLPDISLPLVPSAVRVLFGERGFFVVTPVMAVAAVGMVLLLRQQRGRERWASAAAAAVAMALLAVQISWPNPTGGDSPGARYATGAAAFLAPALLAAWKRWPRIAFFAAGLSTVIMVGATWTNPLVGRDETSAIRIWLQAITRGDLAQTVYGPAIGQLGWVLVVATVAVAVIVLVRVDRAARATAAPGHGLSPARPG